MLQQYSALVHLVLSAVVQQLHEMHRSYVPVGIIVLLVIPFDTNAVISVYFSNVCIHLQFLSDYAPGAFGNASRKWLIIFLSRSGMLLLSQVLLLDFAFFQQLGTCLALHLGSTRF